MAHQMKNLCGFFVFHYVEVAFGASSAGTQKWQMRPREMNSKMLVSVVGPSLIIRTALTVTLTAIMLPRINSQTSTGPLQLCIVCLALTVTVPVTVLVIHQNELHGCNEIAYSDDMQRINAVMNALILVHAIFEVKFCEIFRLGYPNSGKWSTRKISPKFHGMQWFTTPLGLGRENGETLSTWTPERASRNSVSFAEGS